MEYNFVKFKQIGRKYARFNIKPYIGFNGSYIYINTEASKDYKEIKKVNLFVDKENNLIKIVEGNQFKLAKNGKSLGFGGLSNLKMKIGKYKPIEKYIYKLEAVKQDGYALRYF